ncbi:MAG: glycosyltransferase family 2 protein [Acidobacteriota bacterium]|nr:glycosyltransferase family 2 protein [Acidobacteriota bacterium]
MATSVPSAVPKISVVIPARNEEANLERCLRSLVVQRGIPFEILVVDDGSTDRTRQIAESFTRVRQCPFIGANADLLDVHVLDAPPLPEGWSGKVNALVAGEKAAQGQWILFTDADTEHLEDSLAAAVAEAGAHNADLLSYSPEQLLTGIRQQLLMPLIFGELAFQYSPRRVSDPAMPDAAANGQYILVRAAAHRKLGGFAAVSGELLEDVALARRYKSAGRRIYFRLGRGRVRTRMYSTWEALRAGWTKNLALLFPATRPLAQKRIVEFLRLIGSLLFSLFWTALAVVRGVGSIDFLMGFALAMLWLYTASNFALFYLRVSRAHFPFLVSVLSLFGLPWFAGLLRQSAAAHEQGTVEWRGRVYATDAEGNHGANSSGAASNS